MMDKIVFDNIIFGLQNFGGISTYWYELSSRLLNDKNFDSFFITRKNTNLSGSRLDISKNRSFDQSNTPLFIDRFINPKLGNNLTPFVFHSSYNRCCLNPKALNVTTVHDLIHHKYYTGVRKWIHNSQKSYALMNSKAIIAVSENTKRDLIKIYPKLDPEIISVVYNGVSDDYFKIKNVDYHYNLSDDVLKENYFLFVSSRAKYKNFNFIVDLLEKLPDFKLYIVGPPINSEESSYLNSKIHSRWKIFTSITSKSLNELYNHAFSMLYPSSYEGFGIPILEAMKAFCPFIALNSTSIPEVAGDAGILIDELDINEFIKAVESINYLRNDLQLKGKIQVDKFSWDKCYKETSLIYNKLSSV